MSDVPIHWHLLCSSVGQIGGPIVTTSPSIVTSGWVSYHNLQKSSLVWSQVMLLGAWSINTTSGLVFPSLAWKETIVHPVQELQGLTQVLAQCLCQVTGLLVSCKALATICMFCLHPLSSLLRDHFSMRWDRPAKLKVLSFPVIRLTLEFWAGQDLACQGVPIQPLHTCLDHGMDASNGWGQCVVSYHQEGYSRDQSTPLIKFLEMELLPNLVEIPEMAVCHTGPSWTTPQWCTIWTGREGLQGPGDHSVMPDE